jgi:hypothetical protein
MKKCMLMLALVAYFFTAAAQISLSKDITIQVPRDLKIINSSTVNKKVFEKAKWPLFSVDDYDGSLYIETKGIVIKMFFQPSEYIEKDFLQGQEYEFKKLDLKSNKFYSHLHYQIKKMNGFSVFISEKERFDDPIGYLVCYGLPDSLNRYLFAAVQYNKEDRRKALIALTNLLKGVDFK